MALDPDDIGQFFAQYAGAFNRALASDPESVDLQAIAGHFTSCFIESHEGGVTCGDNGPAFLKILEKGYAYYRSIGTKEMSVTGVDTTPITDDHSVATVHWRGAYHTKAGRDVVIDFDVHYFVKSEKDKSGALKILGFIAGDEQGALRRAGVI
jgi:hypothetical protein